MLSIRQPLIDSPSTAFSGFSPPLTTKIAIRWSVSVTIPVSRVSARSESVDASGEALCGGRRVLLNSGRAKAVATSSSILGFCCRRMGGTISGRAAALTIST